MLTLGNNVAWMVLGSLMLCLFATVQKIAIGAPLVVHGYIVPTLFGSLLGLVCGAYIRNLKKTRELLRRTNAALDQRVQARTRELEAALAEIKTLRGILPICSHCKRVRDERGHWQDIDVYVRKHTHADFSHGICPDCIDLHYADFKDAGHGH